MSGIAGERSQAGGSRRPVAFAQDGRTGREVMLVDGSVLLLVPVVVWAFSRHAAHPGLGVLLAFGLLAFVLLRRAATLPLRAWARLVTVPIVMTMAAMLTLVLWRVPAVGLEAALRSSIEPWLVVTACLISAHVVLIAAPRAGTTTAIDVFDRSFKRVLDVLVAFAILALTAPIAALIAIAIWFEDRGPVFYRCERFGARGRRLQLLKFRKMRPDADGPPLTAADDHRFTRVGRFLARSKLDELPQLWNVLKGEMSLVGPRPEDPEFVDMYADQFEEIARVRPGITGLCQLAFAKEAEIIDGDDRVRTYAERYLPEKLKIDLLYVRQRSILFDLKIMLWTALVLLRMDVAVNRQTGELTLRRRG